MMKLLMLAAALALAVAEPEFFVREWGPLRTKLSAGDGSVLVAQAHEEDVSQRSVIISNRIIQFVEGYRHDLVHGNDAHPPLDPYRNEELGPYVVGTANLIAFRLRTTLNDVLITGVNSFDIESLVFSLLRMNLNFHVNIPAIRVMTGYAAEARLALVATHRASGIARVTVTGISVKGFMQLTLSGGALQASQLDLDIDVDNTIISLTELTGVGVIDFVLNWVIQNVSSDLIQDSMGEISQTVSSALFDTINEVLKNFTLDDLLGN